MKTESIELLKAAKKINEDILSSEKFALPLLAIKTKKAALENPTDQSLRLLSNVFNKMSENGSVFITRAEFKNIFSKFASTSDSLAGNLFADELGVDKVEEINRKLAGELPENNEINLYSQANTSISNALSSLWDDVGNKSKSSEYKLYNPEIAKQANNITDLELSRMGVPAKQINTFAGTENFIICNAIYETPKGEVNLLIPVELSKSGALIPTFFVSNHGFADLTKKSVKEHVIASAGNNFTVNSDALLDALNTAKQVSTMSEFEIKTLAIKDAINSKMKKQASVNSTAVHYNNTGVYLSKIDDEVVVAEAPKYKDFDKFASELNSCKGIAEFIFGKNIIEDGRSSILRKINSFGYNSQISVASCDDQDKTITYAVKVDTNNGPIGFEVIAEVYDNKVIIPSIIAAADKAYDFDKTGIAKLAKSNFVDYKSIAVVSPLYELKSSEIIENIRKAADVGDYKTAEEALTVLAERADAETYNVGFIEYMRSVNSISNPSLMKQASKKSCCSRIITASTHSEPICGHLNLPLDKVYQNENGQCVPLYRQNMTDTYEGVLFNTSKIFG